MVGIVGNGVSNLELLYINYKSMDNLRYAPNFIDNNSVSQYGYDGFNWNEDF